jgi:poly(3-hydroxybutyrate) depolymerase
MAKACCVLMGVLSAMAIARFAGAANVSDFIDFSLRNNSNQVILPGRLYVPPEASNLATPRPFILFFHGAGEDGTDNVSQVNANIDNLLAEAKRRGAYLYAPQTTNAWNGISLLNNVQTMIVRAEATQNVDSHRLYVTGLSNGGGGTWTMLSRFPTEFAAAVPISGVKPATDFVAAHLLNEPIWAFHARDDTTVSVSVSHDTISSLLTADGYPLPTYPASGSANDFFISNPDVPFHQTVENLIQGGTVSEYRIPGSHLDLMYYELATGGHIIWPGVYDSPQVYDWMFAHTTLVPEPSTLVQFLAALALILPLSRRRS